MVLDFALNIVLSLAYALFGTFIAAIPIFVLVLVGWAIYKFTAKPKHKTSWIARTMAITYIIVFCIIAFAYFAPLLSAGSSIGSEPSDIAPDLLTEILPEWAFYVLRTLAVALALALILLPLEFFGAFINEMLIKKYALHRLLSAFIATFLSTAAAMAVILLFPGIPAGIIYMVYFA